MLARSDCRHGLTLHPAALPLLEPSSNGHSNGNGSGNGLHALAEEPANGHHSGNGNGNGNGVGEHAEGEAFLVGGLSSAERRRRGSRVRLADCELSHAVQVFGGELDLEGVTFALAPSPADLPTRAIRVSDPDLAARLAQAAAAAVAARGGLGSAYAGLVGSEGVLRLRRCVVGGGGEGEHAVLEAEPGARVIVSRSKGVLIGRRGSEEEDYEEGGALLGSGSESGSESFAARPMGL